MQTSTSSQNSQTSSNTNQNSQTSSNTNQNPSIRTMQSKIHEMCQNLKTAKGQYQAAKSQYQAKKRQYQTASSNVATYRRKNKDEKFENDACWNNVSDAAKKNYSYGTMYDSGREKAANFASFAGNAANSAGKSLWSMFGRNKKVSPQTTNNQLKHQQPTSN